MPFNATLLKAAGWQVPGNIRRAEHFVAFLRRFVAYLKEKLGVNQVETENPTTFLAQLQERLNIDGKAYHLLSMKLDSCSIAVSFIVAVLQPGRQLHMGVICPCPGGM